MIRYADDFILMCKNIKQPDIDMVHSYLDRMGLIVNEEKSRMLNAKEEPFDFLGFRFRYSRSVIKKNGFYWNIEPKPKSQQKIRQKIHGTLKSIGHYAAPDVVDKLNPILRGWMNYYKIEKVSNTQVTFRKLEEYLRIRLNRFYNRKSQRKCRTFGNRAFEALVKEYGLIKPYAASAFRPVNAFRRNC